MYKKLLLVLLSIITIQAAKAQTEKGSQNLGLTFGVSTINSNNRNTNSLDNTYSQTDNIKQTSYSFVPDYSYFIADKLDIGVGLGYGHSNSKYNTNMDPTSEQISKSFSAIVSLRKYFLFDNKIGIRTGPFLRYQIIKQENIYTDSKNNYDSDVYAGGISMDFVYYPAKNIGLAAGLGNISYSHQKNTGNTEGSFNVFGANFANNLSLSVYYVFGK
jgi:hypothetical protein